MYSIGSVVIDIWCKILVVGDAIDLAYGSQLLQSVHVTDL